MHILLVEDDPNIMEMLEIVFKKRGDSTVGCVDGGDVVDYASGMHGPYPDVIILDYHLPVMTGAEVLKALGEHPIAKLVPVIVYTASPHSALSAMDRHPCASFVQKGRLRVLLDEVDLVTPDITGEHSVISEISHA